VEAVSKDGILTLPGVGDLAQETPTVVYDFDSPKAKIKSTERLTARLGVVSRRLADEQERLALALRFRMEKLRVYSEGCIGELQAEKTELER
jgi:hypothetical protein